MLKVIDIANIGEEVNVDMLGRITIPVGLRRKYGVISNKTAVIIPTEEGIFIKSKDEFDRNKIKIAEQVEKVVEEYLNKKTE